MHFITPDPRGAQPFDIIAVKNGRAFAIECKTLVDSKKHFTINRLEENQRFAFKKWMDCGNSIPVIAIKHKGKIIMLRYDKLIENNGKINVEEMRNGI